MYSQRCRLLKLRLQLLIAEWCSDSVFSNSSILAAVCAPLKPFQAKACSHKWTWSSTWWPLSTQNVRRHKAAWWHARGCFGFACFFQIFKIIQMKDPKSYYMATSSRRGHFDESSKPSKHTIFEAANLLDAALEKQTKGSTIGSAPTRKSQAQIGHSPQNMFFDLVTYKYII